MSQPQKRLREPRGAATSSGRTVGLPSPRGGGPADTRREPLPADTRREPLPADSRREPLPLRTRDVFSQCGGAGRGAPLPRGGRRVMWGGMIPAPAGRRSLGTATRGRRRSRGATAPTLSRVTVGRATRSRGGEDGHPRPAVSLMDRQTIDPSSPPFVSSPVPCHPFPSRGPPSRTPRRRKEPRSSLPPRLMRSQRG